MPALARQAAQSPNYVVVVVDDQSSASFKARYMPRTFSSIVRPGTRFADGLAAPPLCCPDRAGILTGQYPHNTGVFSNTPGYPELRDKRDALPVWLHRAGFRTGFVGKYLNDYSHIAGTAAAPGFDSWFGFYGPERYTNYRMSDGTNIVGYGNHRRDYSTDVLTSAARDFIHQSSQHTRPFFLYLAYHAPHRNRVKGGRCRGHDPLPERPADFRRYRHARLPMPPSFDERNVSDKPHAIASLPRIATRFHEVRTAWRCTLAALRDLDRGIGSVMDQLRQDGELGKTVVFYVSDNGVFFGEHRIAAGKQYPYEPALQVPFAVRVPPAYRAGPPPPTSNQVVANEDIAPTILDLAGLDPPPTRHLRRLERLPGPGRTEHVAPPRQRRHLALQPRRPRGDQGRPDRLPRNPHPQVGVRRLRRRRARALRPEARPVRAAEHRGPPLHARRGSIATKAPGKPSRVQRRPGT